MQELEEEATALKYQLLSTSTSAPRTTVRSVGALPPHRQTNINTGFSTSTITSHSGPAISSNKTLPRTIDGLELASSIIDDCFELYVLSL